MISSFEAVYQLIAQPLSFKGSFAFFYAGLVGSPWKLEPSARSQFCALSYRQISACIDQAVAKASVMRLLGIPRLPMQQLVPRSVLARNCPGPADSLSPPVLPSYTSTLASFALSSSVSSSPAHSP